MTQLLQTDTHRHTQDENTEQILYFVKVKLARLRLMVPTHAHVCVHTSVECPSAMWCPTQTRNLLVLNWKLVVISDFFVGSNVPLGVNDNFLLVAHGNDLGIAIGLKEEGRREIWDRLWSLMNDQINSLPFRVFTLKPSSNWFGWIVLPNWFQGTAHIHTVRLEPVYIACDCILASWVMRKWTCFWWCGRRWHYYTALRIIILF